MFLVGMQLFVFCTMSLLVPSDCACNLIGVFAIVFTKFVFVFCLPISARSALMQDRKVGPQTQVQASAGFSFVVSLYASLILIL